ncbi:helix-turn-helix domain-containing protein [Elizabethkingia anophelis]|nr:helix-turn-helix domain-containing protein [Elizabethkingia anophelis]MCT4060605.1 helix-turn-helix domain-containing protein [Elizabethkingia anophelis]MCT4106897.1 helix-turn-helix domain-containing protein [Elizabethkingia anophelis]
MINQFGERIRQLREKQNLYLRQVAPLLEMDTALLSKIENGVKQLKKEQISILAEALKGDKEELTTLWLADQVANLIEGEPMANKALKTVSNNIKKIKK